MNWNNNFEIENVSFEFNGVLYIEEWKPISGYDILYEISSFGRVKSLKKLCMGSYKADTIMKLSELGTNGYLKVNLLKKSVRKTFRIHRLVALHFLPKIKGKEVVNHLNSDRTCNFFKNLEWATTQENVIHSFKFGRRASKGKKVVLI